MPDINTDQLAAMEEEFLKLQKLEIGLSSKQSLLQKLIAAFGIEPSLYTKQKKLESLIDEVDDIIAEIARKGQIRGKVMAQKTMERFLEKSERASLKQRTLAAIDRANSKRAQDRMGIYVDEVLKEKGILQADIDLFRKRAALAGFSDKDITKQLVMAAEDGTGPVPGFAKRVQSIETAVLRREAAAAEVDEYRKVALPDEKWEWITISTSPCPDCRIRAGVVLSYEDWEKRGLPGAGRTICQQYCMCKLMPMSVADDLFPEVKTYRWNKDTAVLTTDAEMRTFGAKKNKGAE